MLVLVSAVDPSDAADLERLRLARRTLGHERLVLFAPQESFAGLGEAVARQQALGADIQIIGTPAHEADVALEIMRETLATLQGQGHQVRACAGGGTTPMSVACLLACVATGTPAWFFDAGRSQRLAIPRRHVVTERFTPVEQDVLARVDAPVGIDELAASAGLRRTEVVDAVYRLRRDGLVVVDKGLRVCATPMASGLRTQWA